jgi:hypothetical protein
VDAVLSVLTGPLGAPSCPKAGIAAIAVNVNDKRKTRCLAMTAFLREHPPNSKTARPVTGVTIECYINFPADQKRPGMPAYGPIAPTAEPAACPQLAEGDIRTLDTEAVFDPGSR